MPLNPDAAAYLANTTSYVAKVLDGGYSIDAVRRGQGDAAGAAFGPRDAVATVADSRVPGGPPIRVYRPDATAPLPIVLHFHGGGYVFGDLDTQDSVCRAIAARTPAVVVAVDYRLAPEHPYPAAIDDSWHALEYAYRNAETLGGDAARVAVGGDSAGGGIAAVMAIRARDAGLPLRLQFLVYPVADHDPSRPSMREYSDGYGLTTRAMDWYLQQYLTREADWRDPEVFPLNHPASLDGVAPAHVVTVEYDPIRDSGEAYAARLRADGVRVVQIREPGLIHGAYRIPGTIPAAARILDDIIHSLQQAFA
ncbi:alpha/beta hydrolase [Dactylosporangium sp. CA-233914]|uniref:alpha/beta hydrolase n=1 Tax=Dactylosporangium sp. CA-233914 TaxID=3239934 RepID=UPI003D8D2AF2